MLISRRFFIQASAALPFVSYALATENFESYSDPKAADEWIIKYQKTLDAVEQTFLLGRFADRYYYLTKYISWKPNPGQALSQVIVPEGFVTDFASVPRAFWSALPTDGEYAYAAVIHDYLYWTQTTSREDADLTLKYAMQDFGVGSVTIETIYRTVRAAGGMAWKENAALKKSGEKRTLKKYPDKPTIKWVDWKMNPDVFT
ncbi:DUF1353 domain-containing protein [Pseudomonas chlororaphis]|uniref:DUF1353 domain-containing protein n=1 Tax=Pseudomonas chlororaphis TaxID=587753 RepID=UPI0039E1718C